MSWRQSTMSDSTKGIVDRAEFDSVAGMYGLLQDSAESNRKFILFCESNCTKILLPNWNVVVFCCHPGGDVVLSCTRGTATGSVLCRRRHLELCVHFCWAAHTQAVVSWTVWNGSAVQNFWVSRFATLIALLCICTDMPKKSIPLRSCANNMSTALIFK